MTQKTVTLTVEWKSLLERMAMKFATGAISGALGALTVIAVADYQIGLISSWADLTQVIWKISAAIFVGMATGGFEALRKYFAARGDYSN